MAATFLVNNTLGRGMALRPAPVSRDLGKPWPDGTKMAGLGAEQDAYGWTWRQVRDPEGNAGWMPSNYLIQDEDDSTPDAGNSGPLAPSVPPTLIIVPTIAARAPTIAPTPRSVAGAPTASAAPEPTATAEATPVVLRQAAPAPREPYKWALGLVRVEATDRRIVSNEAGVTRTQTASGKFQRIYFMLRNIQKQSSSVSSSSFTLTDAQGRTYSSDFEVRQDQPEGGSSAYGGSSIVPNATVALNIDFDVAADATELVLHTRDGPDLKVTQD